MRRRVVLVLATMALAILLAGGMAQAIINGQPDRGPKAHPYVGTSLEKFEGKPLQACSGTLISARVFLTAGHCTQYDIERNLQVYVSFDPTYKVGASKVIKGTPYTHPKICLAPKEGCPRYDRYDVGVIVLKEPVRMATYGALPQRRLVDTLKKGQRLTTVGYGATGYKIDGQPPPRPQLVYPDDRYRGTVRLLNTRDPHIDAMFLKSTGVSLLKGKGAAPCFGDSGGPLFMPDQQTIVGVDSYGTFSSVCRGPEYYQRVDLPRVLKWVRSFV